MMNWDDLRLFLVLARNGRVSVAAKHLKLDATTLVRRIKRLESELNTSLFELTGKGYRLTDAGKQLVSYVEGAERFFVDGKRELTGERSELAGDIRVSVAEGFGSWVLAPHLANFKQDYPQIGIDLVASSGFLNLNKREADLAILLERPSKGLLYTRKLTNYRLQLYGQRDYLAQYPPISQMQDLHTHKLISYIPDLLYTSQLRFIEEAAMSTAQSLRSSSINAQYRMTAAGGGLCILPCFIADTDASLQPVLPQQISIQRSFWLATHRDVRGLARIDVFIDWLFRLADEQQGVLMGQSIRAE